MRRLAAAPILALLVVCAASVAFAQNPSGGRDELLDHMTGTWNLEGVTLGQQTHHTLTAEWVLDHHFLRLHEITSANAPANEKHYEALWFLAYDDLSERYVAHLFDVFGARFSETLGYGPRKGNSIFLTFEYPDGPFHTTYEWLPESGSWRWLLEQKDKDGKWTTFADFKLTRAPAPR
ncbi:MAG TPA: hypothetical protein VJO53_14610 [Candidatus Acidoferrales bacterium]|nr:hypothetical protein [Candidatus Acidoferrales bacterium]